MTTRHTPGPWSVEAGNLTAEGGRCILAALHTWDLDAPEEAAANARLMELAPELFEFVAGFLADYQSEDGLYDMKHYAKKAHELVAKAT